MQRIQEAILVINIRIRNGIILIKEEEIMERWRQYFQKSKENRKQGKQNEKSEEGKKIMSENNN